MRLRDHLPQLDGATDWLNSGILKKEDLIGKPILFHFWSISCDLCKVALPQINQLRDHYRGRLHVIAVHMPRSKEDLYLDDVENMARKYDIMHPIYVDHDDVLTDKFSVRYVPAYFLFDEEGKLRHYQSGDNTIRMLTKRIDRLI